MPFSNVSAIPSPIPGYDYFFWSGVSGESMPPTGGSYSTVASLPVYGSSTGASWSALPAYRTTDTTWPTCTVKATLGITGAGVTTADNAAFTLGIGTVVMMSYAGGLPVASLNGGTTWSSISAADWSAPGAVCIANMRVVITTTSTTVRRFTTTLTFPKSGATLSGGRSFTNTAFPGDSSTVIRPQVVVATVGAAHTMYVSNLSYRMGM